MKMYKVTFRLTFVESDKYNTDEVRTESRNKTYCQLNSDFGAAAKEALEKIGQDIELPLNEWNETAKTVVCTFQEVLTITKEGESL